MKTLYDILNSLNDSVIIKDKSGGLWNKLSMLPYFPKEQLGTPSTISTGISEIQTITLSTGQYYQIIDLIPTINEIKKSDCPNCENNDFCQSYHSSQL